MSEFQSQFTEDEIRKAEQIIILEYLAIVALIEALARK